MQNNNSKYTGEEKTHFKLYKSGKSWLIGGISSLMLFTGVVAANQVTAHADASTGTSDASLTKEGSSAADTNSVTLSAASATATTADTTNGAATSASNDSDTASSAASSSSVSNATNQNSSSTSASGATSASEATGAPSAQTSNATSAGSSSSDTNSASTDGLTSTSANTLAAASSAATSSVSSALVAPKAFSAMVAADDTTPTAVTLTDVPTFSNLYTEQQGYVYGSTNYILYDSDITLNVYPYQGVSVGAGEMYGFYVVLPLSITANLATLQSDADTFVTTLQNDDFDISSLTVYQLNDTSDGRQVYYFRPNDGAERIDVVPNILASMQLTVHTAAYSTTTPETAQFNADSYAEVPTDATLFAGIGDFTVSTALTQNYQSIASSELGSNIPDANLVAINLSGINRTLTYTHIQVTDTYNVVDSVTGQTVKTITTAGQDGSTYSRADLISTLSQLGLSSSQYLSDITVSSGTTTDTETYVPVTWNTTDAAAGAQGTTYTVYVTSIQTAIDVENSTIIAGPDATWTAADNLVSAKDENGNALSISGVTVTGTVNTNVPGTYQVTYSYTDSEGNVTSEVATITVVASQASVTAKDTTLVAGPSTSWTAADNFVSATDENGDPVDLSDVTVTGTVDTTVPGTYQVTYSYTDAQGNVETDTANVTVVASEAGVKTTNTTVIAGPDTPAWTAADNFTSATDENGNPLTLSDVTVTGTADTTTPGTYDVTYSYTDDAGNLVSSTATITVVASKTAVNTKNTTFVAGPSTTWSSADNFVSATDALGNAVGLSDVTVTGTVDPTTPGTYDVTYSYTDSVGNVVSKTATITVVASQSSIDTKDTTVVAGPDATWTAANNFVSATDENGNALSASDMTVTGTVDPTTPGTYDVTYSYTDAAGNKVSKTATVTVVASQSSVDTKDSTLIAGPDTSWTAADNFVSATDENGNALSASDVTVTGTVDPTTPGTYDVTYSYTDAAGNKVSKTATVTVVASQSSVDTKDSTLIAGPDTTWTAADNFVSATDADGNALSLSDLTVTGSVDTNTPGNYEVTYSYKDSAGNVISKNATVTVVASQAAINTKNTTLVAGPDTSWTAADNFVSATDASGNALDLSDITVSGDVDTTTPGTYDVTYSYTDSLGNVISKTATVTVVASKATINTKNTTIVAGPDATWTAADNFVSATDANGNAIDLSDVTVSGNVDPTTPGTYNVTYSYTDSAGNTISKTATVTVTATKVSISANDSTVTVGSNWTAADNFVSATDANGNAIGFDDITVTGSVDLSTPGTYNVTYSYTDASGNTVSKTVTVIVKAKAATNGGGNSDNGTGNSSTGNTTGTGSNASATTTNPGSTTTGSSASTGMTQSSTGNSIKGNSSDGVKQNSQTKSNKLPQTGDSSDSVAESVLGLSMLGLTLGMFGFKRRRRN